uniref:Uncharacterized protein n=1 Tax=Acrobeloides nanus TaxID=290746 RepID=A0A914E7S6_9BILA
MQFDCGTTSGVVLSVTVKFNIGTGCTFQFKDPNPESPCATTPCDVFTNINCVNGMWKDPNGMTVTSAYCSDKKSMGGCFMF